MMKDDPKENKQTDTRPSMSLESEAPGEPMVESYSVSPGADAKIVSEVIYSEIGLVTLLHRLKQSIVSTKEFAIFLKKRSILEEEHSIGLKKLCRVSSENIRKPDHRNGSFLTAYEVFTSVHEQMAENEANFALTLHQMYEDLSEVLNNMERGRKQWKSTGLAAEQRAADAEASMRKSKAKYDALAESYDRARTGDRQSGKIFGLKGPKSAAQHEEDALRKLQIADSDYAMKVQAAQNQRADLCSKSRPEAVRALEELIRECDSALTYQMQKFALFNERLLLSNGLNFRPVSSNEAGLETQSLRDVIHTIDNEKDFREYLVSIAPKIPPRSPEIVYQCNPVLNQVTSSQRPSNSTAPHSSRQGPQQAFGALRHQNFPSTSQQLIHSPSTSVTQQDSSFPSSPTLQHQGINTPGIPSIGLALAPPKNHNITLGQTSYNGPLHASSLPFQGSETSPILSPLTLSPTKQFTSSITNLPPVRPIFGLSLEQLFERDGSAVPMVVYQCIQAVDLFGLEVEGIYRLSGTASHVNKIKSLFDNDASRVDFRDPANFFHDVNSVAGLLKQFFRDLPDPLLTSKNYTRFIQAAKHEDEALRRDLIHAIINSLPDPNYATFRAVILHLNRVQENSTVNRMNINNLAIIFGPTLMGANIESNIQNAGWQVKVVETVLQNCYQIFDDD